MCRIEITVVFLALYFIKSSPVCNYTQHADLTINFLKCRGSVYANRTHLVYRIDFFHFFILMK